MNKDTFKGNWNEFKGKVKEQWGKLTDNDITEIDGKRDQLLGKLQKTYGYATDKAEKELSTFEKSVKFNDKTNPMIEDDLAEDDVGDNMDVVESGDDTIDMDEEMDKKRDDRNRKNRAA
jgi:uncharacterized protein YjbJ (UPF0337 family)